MSIRIGVSAFSLTLIVLLASAARAATAEMPFIRNGRAESVNFSGDPWIQRDDSLEGGGMGKLVFAPVSLGPGDATIKARLRIDGLSHSAASFFIGDSDFGFEGSAGKMFVEGRLFGDDQKVIGEPAVSDGATFDFEVRRRGNELSFWIDGRRIYVTEVRGALSDFGFRPYRASMRIYEWSAEGAVYESPKERRPDFLVDVFKSGPNGAPQYRIPALITTQKGTLLAFCEARRKGAGDTGKIDLVLRRSTDGGQSWGPEEIVWGDGDNTCGNPCPVVDKQTGRIWLPMCWNLASDGESRFVRGTSEGIRRVYVTYSDDDGHTWAPPKDISQSVRRSDWRWYATGPGRSIQLTRGKYVGRLVIPANHSDHTKPTEKKYTDIEDSYYRSHVFYSDDHGETWQLGGVLDRTTNESTIVELPDGSILDNMRSYAGERLRAISVSRDGGDTWSPVKLHPQLVEPVCQASMLRYSFPSPTEKSRILFSNPASSGLRTQLTVRVSYDEGETWPVAAMIYRGSAAYSCLTALEDGSIGVLFERDQDTKISFAKFTLKWLERDKK